MNTIHNITIQEKHLTHPVMSERHNDVTNVITQQKNPAVARKDALQPIQFLLHRRIQELKLGGQGRAPKV